jgi:hypothetical protein
MKISKKTRNFLILLLSIIILVLLIFLFSNLIDYLSVLEKQELYANVIVSDHYGVDVNSSALMFGMLVPGSSSVRKTTITNDHNQEINVEIFVKGDIKEFMQISGNDFNLKVDESKEIVFTAIAPRDKEFGVYEGKVVFVIKNTIVK